MKIMLTSLLVKCFCVHGFLPVVSLSTPGHAQILDWIGYSCKLLEIENFCSCHCNIAIMGDMLYPLTLINLLTFQKKKKKNNNKKVGKCEKLQHWLGWSSFFCKTHHQLIFNSTPVWYQINVNFFLFADAWLLIVWN